MKIKLILSVALVVVVAHAAQAGLVESAENATYKEKIIQSFKALDFSSWSSFKTSARNIAKIWSKTTTSGSNSSPHLVAQTNTPITIEGDKSRDMNARQPASAEGGELNSTAQKINATPQVAPKTMTPEQEQMKNALQTVRSNIEGREAVQIAAPGRAGATQLPKFKSGVATFPLYQEVRAQTAKSPKGKGVNPKEKMVKIPVTDIPRLDIGVERTISKNDFTLTNFEIAFKKPARAQSLPSPALIAQKEITKQMQKPIDKALLAKSPKKGEFELGQIVTLKRIQSVPIELQDTVQMQPMRPVNEIDKDDLKMISAVILFDKKDKCHLASGLLIDLVNNKKYAEEANYYLGVCAHKMGFHTEAVNRLLRVIESEHPDFTSEAIANLVEDLPRDHDLKVYAAIKKLKNKAFILDGAKDNLNYIMARAAHTANNFAEALDYSAKVSEKSQYYLDAQYMHAIGLYGVGKVKEAELKLIALREYMTKKNKKDVNIEALLAANIARMRFMQARYQAALDEYLKIPKNHPLWVQGLIEQGWSQLSADDPEGAIGNMYSLHSPYFKSVFMPESYVVRTIGYIDICQYGDAYKTLTKLEQLHGHWVSAIRKYRDIKKSPDDYYNTVKTYLRAKSDTNVDGLPYQVIREIARQRGFLNAQSAINVRVDEIAQYNFILGIVKKDIVDAAYKITRSQQRLDKIKADLAAAKKNSELQKNVIEWNALKKNEEQLLSSLKYQREVFVEARNGYLRMKDIAIARIEKENAGLRQIAGKELITHLKDIQARFDSMLEGNEFLRYEIFSGSGENIRYQVSGGSTAEARRIPANVKPQKLLNWEFDGEYWEDEIGSYRSTLVNNCPKNQRTVGGKIEAGSAASGAGKAGGG